MCISAAVLAVGSLVASTAVTAVGSIVNARQASDIAYQEADYRSKQLQVQNTQLIEDMRLAEVQAMQQENERQDQARRLRAANDAFIAGSGVGENISYMQGTDKANDLAVRQDVANLRLQSAVQRGRIVDQIGVNRMENQFAYRKAALTSRQATTNAFFNTATSVANNAYSYAKLKV